MAESKTARNAARAAALTTKSSAHATKTLVVATHRDPGLPSPQGLYDPSREHDACGVGFGAHIKNRKSHYIVEMGL